MFNHLQLSLYIPTQYARTPCRRLHSRTVRSGNLLFTDGSHRIKDISGLTDEIVNLVKV